MTPCGASNSKWFKCIAYFFHTKNHPHLPTTGHASLNSSLTVKNEQKWSAPPGFPMKFCMQWHLLAAWVPIGSKAIAIFSQGVSHSPGCFTFSSNGIRLSCIATQALATKATNTMSIATQALATKAIISCIATQAYSPTYELPHRHLPRRLYSIH